MRLAALLDPRRRAREAQLAHALRSVPLFQDLPAADLVDIWQRLSELRVPAGTALCERGEPGDRLYIIQSGTVEVRLGLGADGITIRRDGPGNCVGEMSLITGEPRSADLVVAEDAVLWVLERADFEALAAHSVPLLRALNRVLCKRIGLMTLQLEDLEERAGQRGARVAGLRFGPYRVIEQIGSGGMAVVFSAVHVETEEAAAVKVLPAAWGESAEFRARLAREAAVLQELRHPHIIRVLEVGEVEARAGGGCYLAMEWLPHALDRVLRAQYPDPLPLATALGVAARVAEALAAVHALEVVHRDVKPSNIMLRADGAPVLMDFGLVTARADQAQGRRLTASNVAVGTADYMSPEQIAGTPLDGRSDVYALGVVLYEMLAGHVPFAGRDPLDTLRAHVEEAPPPLPAEVPAAACEVVARALAKRPADRFASAAAMASALEAAAATEASPPANGATESGAR
jgi:CRP-like cAMP-binding protein